MNEESAIKDLLCKVVGLNDIVGHIRGKGYSCCLIGGAIRDILNNRKPKDYDLIVCVDVDVFGVLHDFLGGKNYIINRAGGIKLFYKDEVFDIWSFKGQIGMSNGLYDKKIENLHECCFFNYNSIVYDIENDILYSKGYEECLKNGCLDLVGNHDVVYKNPLWALNIARAVSILINNDFIVSVRLKDYIMYCLNKHKCLFSIVMLCYEGHYHLDWTELCDEKLQLLLVNIS